MQSNGIEQMEANDSELPWWKNPWPSTVVLMVLLRAKAFMNLSATAMLKTSVPFD